jgi:hypothetical protein
MPSHNLTRTQRNAVLEEVSRAGLDPRDFVWTEVWSSQRSEYVIERLIHSPTGHWFEFDVSHYDLDSLVSRCSPGIQGGVLSDESGLDECAG